MPMRPAHVLAPLALLALCGACCFGAGSGSAGPDITPDEIARLRIELDCSAQAFYCAALDRFETGTEPVIESRNYALLGRAFSLYAHEEQVDWFVGRQGGGMAFGNVAPDDEEEARQLEEILAMLAAGAPVPPTHPVAAYVQSLAVTADQAHATSVHGRSRHYPELYENAEIYIRQVGTELIAVEVSPTGGAVGVFQRQ